MGTRALGEHTSLASETGAAVTVVRSKYRQLFFRAAPRVRAEVEPDRYNMRSASAERYHKYLQRRILWRTNQ